MSALSQEIVKKLSRVSRHQYASINGLAQLTPIKKYAIIMAMEKPIRLSEHAISQLIFRGAGEKEIIEAIRTSEWSPAELNRLECRKDFAFNKLWNNKSYKTKQVRPIFAEEGDEIIIITVYVYYF